MLGHGHISRMVLPSLDTHKESWKVVAELLVLLNLNTVLLVCVAMPRGSYLMDVVPVGDVMDTWYIVGRLNERTTTTESVRSEEHTSELQSRRDLVCRLLLEKKKK